LYKSTDAGVTWVDRTSSLNVDIERLATKGSNVLASTLESALYSTNFGDVWFTSSPVGGFIATYTLRDSQIFGGNSQGMSLSTDSGASWTSINEGFPVCPTPVVEASCTDNTYLFAGTIGEGVWRKALSAAPTLSNVVSRKSHGSAGIFDIAMPISGMPGVEDRNGNGG